MDDWDDEVETGGRSAPFGRSDSNSGGRGRGGREGRSYDGTKNSSNDDGFSDRRYDGEDRRGRGGRGGSRGGRRDFNDDGQGGDDNESDNRRGRGGFRGRGGRRDNDNGGGFGSGNRDNDDGGENRRGRGGGRGRGGDRNFGDRSADDGGFGSFDDSGGGGENGDEEKKPPVTYIPQDRTEEQLFEDTGISKGINFDQYEKIDVKVTGENKPAPINSFRDAQFRDLMLSNLKKCSYDKPTPIQKYAIPTVMAGRDLMATAQTGSGKTAAFLLPIIHRLLSEQADSSADGNSCSPQALILSPTRELAIQIKDNARLYTSQSCLKVEIVYGGVSTRHQSSRIFAGCNILIATPGRLMDFVNRGFVKFDCIQFVVLDEADRMLDMGFKSEIEKIMEHPTMTPQDQRQTLMFSATFSKDIQILAANFLRKDYIFLTVGIVGGACKDVEQNFIPVSRVEKKKKLIALLEENQDNDGTLMFVEKKRDADFLASFLSSKNFRTTSIHGDREQAQREEALHQFKTKEMAILVATNVAARGLDIKNVKHVINYDLPKDIDEYVHRIGRTGRLGNKGKATSFYDSSADKDLVNNLVRILKEANQEVPSFLADDCSGAGDYEQGAFGGEDYRKQETSANDDDW